MTFPMPESIVAVPKLACSGDPGTAVFGQTTKVRTLSLSSPLQR